MKKILLLGFLSLLISGCHQVMYSPDSIEEYYPELPDNEYCFQKIVELQTFQAKKENYQPKVFTSENGDVKVYNVMIPPYTLEGYLGILQGRGAIILKQIVCTPEQSKGIFRLLKTMPEFLVEITSVYEYDSSKYRVINFYYKKDRKDEFDSWIEKIIPDADLPRHTTVR